MLQKGSLTPYSSTRGTCVFHPLRRGTNVCRPLHRAPPQQICRTRRKPLFDPLTNLHHTKTSIARAKEVLTSPKRPASYCNKFPPAAMDTYPANATAVYPHTFRFSVAITMVAIRFFSLSFRSRSMCASSFLQRRVIRHDTRRYDMRQDNTRRDETRQSETYRDKTNRKTRRGKGKGKG